MRAPLILTLFLCVSGAQVAAQRSDNPAPYGLRPLWTSPEAAQPGAAGNPGAGRAVATGGDVHAGWACVQCHGMGGDAEGSGGIPRIGGQHAWYLYRQLQDYAVGVRPHAVMTPIARSLSESQMRDVATWYAAQSPSRAAERPDAGLRERQLGASINAVGIPSRQVTACSNCHGQQGEGVAPSAPTLAGQYAPYTALQLLAWKRGERRNGPMGVMAQVAAGLTEAEINAVAAYFAALPPSAVANRAGR